MAETLVSSGAITHRIDQMESAGLVSCRRHPDDGRIGPWNRALSTALGLHGLDVR